MPISNMKSPLLRALIPSFLGSASFVACSNSPPAHVAPDSSGRLEQSIQSAACIEQGGGWVCMPSPGYNYEETWKRVARISEVATYPDMEEHAYQSPGICDFAIGGPGTPWNKPGNAMRYYCNHLKGTYPNPPLCTWYEDCQHFMIERKAYCPSGWTVDTDATGVPFCRILPQNLADPENCTTNRPVNTFNGAKLLAETDIAPIGPAALGLTRYYNSMLVTPAGISGFGVHWLSDYHRFLVFGASRASAFLPNGSVVTFAKNNNVWQPPAGWRGTLVQNLDANGATTGWTYRSPGDEVDTYDAAGRLLSITRSGGAVLSLAYDASGHLTTVSDDFGHSLTFSYADGRIASVTDPAGQVFSYAYDEFNNPLSVSRPGGASRQYLYGYMAGESNGGLNLGKHSVTGIIDENGSRFSTYAYDASGRVASSEHAGGVGRSTFAYNPGAGPQTTVTDALGTQRVFTYQLLALYGRAGRYVIKSISQPCCGGSTTSLITYDTTYGNIKTTTDYLGRKTNFVFDNTRNLPTSITEAYATGQARSATIGWHTTFNKPTQINQPGRRTDLTYDADGHLASRTVTDTSSGASRTWTYTYNANELLASVDGPLAGSGDTTTLTWDASGNLLTITNPAGHTTTYSSHDALGRPHTVTDPNGVVTQLDYTARGDISAATIDPGGANPDVTSFAYDAAGQLVHEWRAIGSVRPYDLANTYDAAHRPTSQTDLFGNKLLLGIDLDDHVVEQTVKDSEETLRLKAQATYDSLGRLATRKSAAGTEVLELGYDNNGNATSVTLPQNTWTSTFDALDRRTSTSDSTSSTVSFTRSPLDWLTQVTDPRNVATTYTVNALGNVSSVASADRGTTVMAFDAAGAVISMTDAAGRTTNTTRDALERPTRYTLQGGATLDFAYDAGVKQKGRLTSMTDTSGSTSWTYDAMGRVTSKTQVAIGLARTLTKTYDAAGRLTQMIYPSGKIIAFTYATQGSYGTDRPASITVNGASVLTNITYAPGTGVLAAWTYGNGQSMSRAFDTDGRVTNNGLGAIAYDAAGRVTSYTSGAESYTYTYDGRDRLTGVAGSATQAYGYDPNGNRTSQTVGGTTRTFAIAAGSNRLASATNPATTYSYDATGALTTNGAVSLTYDALGRVVGGGGAGYARNGFGERVAKTVSGATTVFFYDAHDGYGRLLGEYASDGTTIQEYVYLGNMPLAIVRPSGTYYVKADELNTPRAVVDAAGTTVWSWARLPFGENAPTGSFSLNLRFPGQYYDAETGLFENHHRTYDPTLGRYLQSDPIGLAGGLNTYVYVENYPVQATDPEGLEGSFGTQSDLGRISVRRGENPAIEVTGPKATVRVGGVPVTVKGSFVAKDHDSGLKAAASIGLPNDASIGIEGTVSGGRTEDGGVCLRFITGLKAMLWGKKPSNPTYSVHSEPTTLIEMSGEEVRHMQNTYGLGSLTNPDEIYRRRAAGNPDL